MSRSRDVGVSWQVSDVDDGGMLSLGEDTAPECWSCGKVVSRRAPYTLLRLDGRRWLLHRACKVAAMGRLVELEGLGEDLDAEP